MPKYTNEEFNTWYVNQARADLEKIGFEDVRTMWKKGLRDHKAQSRFLAETALENFAKSGDNTRLNLVLNDLKNDARNYLRPAAFILWAVAHQPIKYENDKLSKDKEATKTEQEYAVLLVEAMSMPYWDFAPDKEMQQFGGGDIVAALDAVIKRFTGKKFAPKDASALDVLTAAMTKVAELRRIVPIESLIAATPASNLVRKATDADLGIEAERTTLAESEAKKAA